MVVVDRWISERAFHDPCSNELTIRSTAGWGVSPGLKLFQRKQPPKHGIAANLENLWRFCGEKPVFVYHLLYTYDHVYG